MSEGGVGRVGRVVSRRCCMSGEWEILGDADFGAGSGERGYMVHTSSPLPSE